MDQELFFKITFAVIVVANAFLAAWNYVKGDFMEFLIASLIVILWFVVAFLISRKMKK